MEEWKKRHDVNKNIDSKQQSLNNNNNNVALVAKKKSSAQRPDSSATSTDKDVTIVTSHLGQGDAVSNKSAEPLNSISGTFENITWSGLEFIKKSRWAIAKLRLCFQATMSQNNIIDNCEFMLAYLPYIMHKVLTSLGFHVECNGCKTL